MEKITRRKHGFSDILFKKHAVMRFQVLGATITQITAS
jgi:hypothetical protein